MSLYQDLTQKKNFFLIAGPCVVEEEAIMFAVAEKLVQETAKRGITFVYKASYKKAN
ncbi:MAG TPA: 3-deoxy-8-phosphooctulonate synthase, partial [Candidatus Cloacimonadota bacterium]|nr:3-deoxy-8-phosphooctulonate synthase [Candidatus Cloacimonadota bacterium]